MAQILFQQAPLHPRILTRQRHKVTRFALLVAATLFLFPVVEAAMLAGYQVQSSSTLDLQFPISNYLQEFAAQGGNPKPTTGRALLFFPKGFDPARLWPILIVTSTTDLDRTSIMDAPWYRESAMRDGGGVLAQTT